MKKCIILFFILIVGVCYFILTSNNKREVKYYTYDGKFVMSSYANKVSDYKKLNSNYFIKEHIKTLTSKEEVIEVLYSGVTFDEYFVYGYYTLSEFNKYFSEYIENGLICDGEYKYYIDEGANYKCIKHKKGYEYEKIESELCAIVNDGLICIKPNDWFNNKNYKESFTKAGWKCEYLDYRTGKHSESDIPNDGYLECSKTKPSMRNSGVDNELFCIMRSDGSVICNDNNNAWCSINSDLNSYCFGID